VNRVYRVLEIEDYDVGLRCGRLAEPFWSVGWDEQEQ